MCKIHLLNTSIKYMQNISIFTRSKFYPFYPPNIYSNRNYDFLISINRHTIIIPNMLKK